MFAFQFILWALHKTHVITFLNWYNPNISYDNHITKIIKIENARLMKNGEISGSTKSRDVEMQEVRVEVSLHAISSQVIIPMVVRHFDNLREQQPNDQTFYDEVVHI